MDSKTTAAKPDNEAPLPPSTTGSRAGIEINSVTLTIRLGSSDRSALSACLEKLCKHKNAAALHADAEACLSNVNVYQYVGFFRTALRSLTGRSLSRARILANQNSFEGMFLFERRLLVWHVYCLPAGQLVELPLVTTNALSAGYLIGRDAFPKAYDNLNSLANSMRSAVLQYNAKKMAESKAAAEVATAAAAKKAPTVAIVSASKTPMPMPVPSAPPLSSAFASTSWSCPQCTLMNNQKETSCAACGNARPWACATCTYINPATLATCSVCTVSRRSGSDVAAFFNTVETMFANK